MAGYALGSVAATTFEKALRDELLAAAGMDRSGFDPGDAVGHADGAPIRALYSRARRPGGGLVSTVDDLLSFAEFAMDDAASWLATGGAVASSQLGSRYGLGWNLERGGQVRWHAGDWGGCHSMLLVVPGRRIAVVVVASRRRRREAAAGLRLGGADPADRDAARRVVPALRTTAATLRGVAARAVGAAVPRTLSS